MSFVLGSAFWFSGLIALPPSPSRGGYDPRQDEEPSPRALAEVQAAYDALCPARNCGHGILRANPTVGMNAVIWVSGLRHGKKTQVKIVYSREFLNRLNQNFGAGASFGVLAHEVGHHLTAAKALRQPMESAWNEELRADYLAGCALGRAGRSSEELENAIRALGSVATASHPSFEKRVPVVRSGYLTCQNEDAHKPVPPFGLGTLVGGGRKSTGCWRYMYRLREVQARLGPIGPKLRTSSGYRTQAQCENLRRKRARDRDSQACVCRRGRSLYQP